MFATRANYVFNIGWVIVLLFLAAVIATVTSWAATKKDQSVLVWEGACTVSELMQENGTVELQCFGSGEVVLASAHSTHIALIGNTSISERNVVPATCRNYQSKRWECRIGEVREFYGTRNVTPKIDK